METYGAGNAPTEKWFIDSIKTAIAKGIVVYNITQCAAGRVEMGLYETSLELSKAGVVSGHDITTEAAITKLMFILGKKLDNEQTKMLLNKSLKGELSH